MKKYFNITNIKLVFILALVCFLFSFSTKRNNDRKLKKSMVEFVGNTPLFVTHEIVNNLLIENKKDASIIRKDALDLMSLENSITQHPMIEKSNVYVGVDGVLKAVVKQRTPIARYFDDFDSYYIDSKGSKMPLSNVFAARVPLLSGEINDGNRGLINELFRFIHNDEFLQKNIIGVKILPSGSVKMKNRNFDYDIDFGKISQVERKFNNYKAFFHKASQDSSLYNYKIINLKFTQQVVCTK
jgi:cell division protein FtsQ